MNETNEEMDTYFEIKPVEHKEEEKSESSKSIKIEDDDYSDDPSKRKKGKKGSYEKKHKVTKRSKIDVTIQLLKFPVIQFFV